MNNTTATTNNIILINASERRRAGRRRPVARLSFGAPAAAHQSIILKIQQRGAQWKQGVVIYMMLYTSLLCNTTPIHCTRLPLHPPVMNTHILAA